jgi:radical SAM superfamily enzyme YgiQ (UPF0313 family)
LTEPAKSFETIMPKILFFNPPSRRNIYLSSNVRVGAPSYPSLTLATLAGNLIRKNTVKIVDLDITADIYKDLFGEIENFKPDIVASSSNTPAYPAVKDIMYKIKGKYPQIQTIVGGVHVTALPEEISKESCFDIAVTGEGDTAIPELLSSPAKNTPERKLMSDLNSMPYPAWQLFTLSRYKNSRLSSRQNPVGLIETSRGCAFHCNFCNKLTFGSVYRAKEPKRVVDEMEYMLASGFREIHIIDDSFTQDVNRAKEICSEIMRRNLKFTWSSFSGVRVDKVDYEFFELARKSGCWQVAFGIETGDQEILDNINKEVTLSQSENAVNLAKKAGLDTFGFFILALSGETEASMRRTIEFAKRLPLDTAKFDICIPYPGTEYFNTLQEDGRIRSREWSKYSCHQIDEPLFDHPNLAWPVIAAYYKRAFREFYLRPSYVAKRFMRSLKKGDILFDIKCLLRSKW